MICNLIFVHYYLGWKNGLYIFFIFLHGLEILKNIYLNSLGVLELEKFGFKCVSNRPKPPKSNLTLERPPRWILKAILPIFFWLLRQKTIKKDSRFFKIPSKWKFVTLEILHLLTSTSKFNLKSIVAMLFLFLSKTTMDLAERFFDVPKKAKKLTLEKPLT